MSQSTGQNSLTEYGKQQAQEMDHMQEVLSHKMPEPTMSQIRQQRTHDTFMLLFACVALVLVIVIAVKVLRRITIKVDAALAKRRSKLEAREWADRKRAELYQFMKEEAEKKQRINQNK